MVLRSKIPPFKKLGVSIGDTRLAESFWENVHANPETGCWEWEGCRDTTGYGRYWFTDLRVQRPAHRVAYEYLVDLVPAELHVDHLCRVRNCVNPDHLDPVTPSENVRRGERSRRFELQTHCVNGHELSGDNLYLDAKKYRHCRICRYEAGKRHRLAETPEQREHRLSVMRAYYRARKAA